MFLEL